MPATTRIAVGVALLTFFVTATASTAASTEKSYLAMRDTFIHQFAHAKNSLDDRPALSALEDQLRAVLGPVRIQAFPGPGKINLLTLKEGIVFGQIDGLRFDADPESLLVTSRDLLAHYLATHPELPKSLDQLTRTDDFYRLVFHADAGVSSYAEIPVTTAKSQTIAHAFLGLASQETGPFVPDTIFIFVADGNKIFIATAPAATKIPDIPRCRQEWERFHQKSITAHARNQSSHVEKDEAVNAPFRYDDQGFAAYRRCFENEAQSQPFFTALQTQAQSLVDRMQLH